MQCPLDDKKYRTEQKGKFRKTNVVKFYRKCVLGTLLLDEWGEFLHKKNEIFTDFHKICKEIEIDTDLVAGENKGICNEPINLKIFSKRVVDLTLVDLPGLTKVPVGDQPPDIEYQIRKLMMKYIENPNCIILVVTPANGDIATSEAIKFAKEVDPDGSRTLAVLTKLDLMDKGTNAIDELNGNVLPIKLGIIGVINRSQQDIIDNKTIDEQLVEEVAYLKREYAAIADRNGTSYLSKRLSNLLITHICSRLPDLKKRVKNMISDYKFHLQSYGDEIIDKNVTLIRIITKFVDVYRKAVGGTIRQTANNTCIYSIIHEQFAETLQEIKADVKKPEAIAYLAETSHGPRPQLFDVPNFDAPFEKLVRKYIRELEEPSLKLVDRVRDEIQRNVKHCENEMKSEWRRFTKLKEKVNAIVNNLIKSRLQVTKEKVKNLVDDQMAYINKNHPHFCKGEAIVPLVNYNKTYSGSTTVVSVQSFAGTLLSGVKSDKENAQVLANLVQLYFSIVRNSIHDSVPKAIMNSLVNYVLENVESELHLRLRLQEADELLTEAGDMPEKRKHALDMLRVS